MIAEPTLAEEVAQDHFEDCIEADHLLKEIVTANRTPTYSEQVFFKSKMGWDDREVIKQRRRMHNVLRLRAIAGSAADRAAAAKEATTAAAVLEKEGPKIADQIAKLEGKLRVLESDARLSAKRVEDQADACRQLRELAPEAIAKEVRDRRNALDATLMRSIYDLQTRENELACCLDPQRYATEAAYLEMLERSHADAVVRVETLNTFRRRLSPHWQTIKAAMELELAELRSQLEIKQADYETTLAPLVARLDYYTTAQGIA